MKNRFLASYTGWIILINVLVFITAIIILQSNPGFMYLLALQPAAVLSGKTLWTFLTSMFMHAPGTYVHIMVNMISLMFLGAFVEQLIGKKRFLLLYLGTGLFAGVFFVAFAYLTGIDMNIYAVGASGAIFGLGGLLMILTPRLPVLVFFIIPMPMWIAMIFLMGVLWTFSITAGLPIGNIAHLGGLLAGVMYGLYLKYKYPQRTKAIARMFSR